MSDGVPRKIATDANLTAERRPMVARENQRTAKIQNPIDSASLVGMTGTLAGRSFPVGKTLTIGRSDTVDLQVAEEDVSRNHAAIERSDEGQFVLKDLNSRNGTFVNGVPIEVRVLEFGDKVQIGGKTLLVFSGQSSIEGQLFRWQRMELIGQMSAGVIHDLNNLITAIAGNVQYLQMSMEDGPLEQSMLENCLGEVRRAAQQAGRLANGVLGLARQPQEQVVPVRVASIVGDGIRFVQKSLRTVTVRTEIEPDLVVMGDVTQLLQVVINLLLNSRDAMPEGGQVTIRSQADTSPRRRAAKKALLEVIDTGIGMDDESLRRVFEPLFTTKPPGKGTGLGMASVKRIVAWHGGSVSVESELGKGTTVRIALPLATAQSTASTRAVPKVEGEGLVVLLEQDERVRQRVERCLKGSGYDLLCADDASEMLFLSERYAGRVALAIINIDLKGVRPADICDQLASVDHSTQILITSGSDEARTRDIVTKGIAKFLKNPGTRTFRDAINMLLG